MEHAGPWGPSPHPAADLPGPEAAALHGAAARWGARLLLIRRPGRRRRDDGPVWGLAETRHGQESLCWGTYPEGRLAEQRFDLDATTPASAPAYLVCTQGRHDRCCAIDGRPVAAALAARRPAETWECTHVGGDRFAANLLVLPHGLLYGHTDTDSAFRIVEAYEDGHVVPAHLRGRSAGAPALQFTAAEVRRRTGITRLDAIEPLGVSRTGPDRWSVTLRLDGSTVVHADLVESHDAGAHLLTCAATGPGSVRRFAVTRFETSSA